MYRKSVYLLISRVSRNEHYKVYAEYTLDLSVCKEYNDNFKKAFNDRIDEILNFDEALIKNAHVINSNQKKRYYLSTFSAYRVYRHDWDSEKNCFLCDDKNKD